MGSKKSISKPKWRKIGGGSFHLTRENKTQIIKPGEEFMAFAEDIPFAFRDVVVLVKKGSAKPEKIIAKESAFVYKLKIAENDENKEISSLLSAIKIVKKEEKLNEILESNEKVFEDFVDLVTGDETMSQLKEKMIDYVEMSLFFDIMDSDGKKTTEKPLIKIHALETMKLMQ